MSFRSKRELLAQVAPRYQLASGAQKSIILDEFVAATHYARKYAIRLLTRPPLPAPAQIRSFVASAKDPSLQEVGLNREISSSLARFHDRGGSMSDDSRPDIHNAAPEDTALGIGGATSAEPVSPDNPGAWARTTKSASWA